MSAISLHGNATPSLLDDPADAGRLLITAHGAGQGPDAPFMAEMARRGENRGRTTHH